MSSEKKHVRELELARQLASVFQELPAKALMNFSTTLADSVRFYAEAENEDVNDGRSVESVQREDHKGWTTLKQRDVQLVTAPAIACEVSLPKSQERLDVVVPIAPLVLACGRIVTSLVFELKLGSRDKRQLESYARQLSESLVISISRDDVISPIEQDPKSCGAVNSYSGIKDPYWVCQTWDHLYFALQDLLSGDPQRRVSIIDPLDDLLFGFDHKIPGQDRLTFICERLLGAIEERNLLSSRNLTLVVPIGKNAKKSLGNTPPYYAHGIAWRSGYRYIACVEAHKLDSVYVVLESHSTARIDGKVPLRPDSFADKRNQALWEHLCAGEELRVSLLSKMEEGEAVRLGVPIGKEYREVGEKKRRKTFVLSHRYFDHISELGKYFK